MCTHCTVFQAFCMFEIFNNKILEENYSWVPLMAWSLTDPKTLLKSKSPGTTRSPSELLEVKPGRLHFQSSPGGSCEFGVLKTLGLGKIIITELGTARPLATRNHSCCIRTEAAGLTLTAGLEPGSPACRAVETLTLATQWSHVWARTWPYTTSRPCSEGPVATPPEKLHND